MVAIEVGELTRRVKEEANRLGFDLVGITSPEPPPHLDVFRRWLDKGRQGEMSYLADENSLLRRSDPRQILPECRSILVVGANYLALNTESPEGRTKARVAAYALGDDYHDVLIHRLRILIGTIESFVGGEFPHRIYTDTGPILERELAQRAGLGWIGKNTCLIHPKNGSYFLLAEVYLGLDLEFDRSFTTDHCGTCTRCLDACPTNCILPDRTLDARQCISYLTIELKGSVDPDLRPAIHDWIFGCDICQQVCPWNQRFSTPSADPEFQPRPFLLQPEPAKFLELAPGSWKEHLRDSPLLRPRRQGLVRNAAIVAGNRGDPSLIDPLRTILISDVDPMPRSHAAWALGQIGGDQAWETLRGALNHETDPGVRAEIEAALILKGKDPQEGRS